MTDIETTVENARAQWHYPPIRTTILPSDVDELQLRLADRLRRHRHQHALEVIADLGRVFDAEEAEPAIEALGRLLVHASLLAGCERMAIAPIIALGREMTRDSGVSSELPLKPAAMLAMAVIGHPHDRDPNVVQGLAMAIAKAIDDCEIVHELKIDPLELFKVAAREVLDGKPVTAVTAPAVHPDKAALRAEAWTELRKASEAVVADDLKQVPDGEPVVLSQRPPEKCQMCGASGDVQDDDPEIWTCANGHHVVYCTRKAWDPDGGRPVNPDVLAAAIMADDLAGAATPEQRANVEHWYKTPHEMLTGKVTHAELDAAALAIGPPTFARRIVPDPGNPGGQGAFGEHPWPPDHRWETDAELRERIKASMSPVSGSPEACNDHRK